VEEITEGGRAGVGAEGDGLAFFGDSSCRGLVQNNDNRPHESQNERKGRETDTCPLARGARARNQRTNKTCKGAGVRFAGAAGAVALAGVVAPAAAGAGRLREEAAAGAAACIVYVRDEPRIRGGNP
jgi:hypothetical protein